MRAVLEVDAEAVRLVDAWCVGDGDDGDATDGERTAAVGGEGGTELGRVAMGFPRPKCNMVVTSFFIYVENKILCLSQGSSALQLYTGS